MSDRDNERIKYIETIFQNFKDQLVEDKTVHDPEMKYHVMADGVYWTDEGIDDCPYDLENAFRFVLNYRTHLLTNTTCAKKDVVEVFNLAKRYFPNWIGFQANRCSYNEQIANRIQRIRKVSDWKIKKLFQEDDID